VRNVFHAEAQRDGRGAENDNGDNKKNLGSWMERNGAPVAEARPSGFSPRLCSFSAPPRGITLRAELRSPDPSTRCARSG